MAIMTRNFNEYDFGDPAEAAETVKRKALEFGADAVGIGSIDRWATAPLQMDPKQIMPECKSIIGMVFRVERGSLRGIEEGTYFSNYSAMGYGGITYLYMPMTRDTRRSRWDTRATGAASMRTDMRSGITAVRSRPANRSRTS